MSHPSDCTCTAIPTRDLVRGVIEGKANPCPWHGGDNATEAADPLALNSPRLEAGLLAALNRNH